MLSHVLHSFLLFFSYNNSSKTLYLSRKKIMKFRVLCNFFYVLEFQSWLDEDPVHIYHSGILFVTFPVHLLSLHYAQHFRLKYMLIP